MENGTASVTAGSTRWNRCPATPVPQPPIGAVFSFTPNTRISTMPSRKPGRAKPTVDTIRATWSKTPPRRRAETTPTGTDSATVNTPATATRAIVGPSRAPTMAPTDVL